jgi:ribosome-associated translation inhibitor RaiA
VRTDDDGLAVALLCQPDEGVAHGEVVGQRFRAVVTNHYRTGCHVVDATPCGETAGVISPAGLTSTGRTEPEPLNAAGQPMTNSSSTPVLPSVLRPAGGFRDSELPHLLTALAPLEKHLARWDADQVDLQLSVKDRGGPEQHVTIEAKLGGWPLLVAKAADPDLDRALHEARDELVRQIEDERRRRIPKDNRKLRDKPEARP